MANEYSKTSQAQPAVPSTEERLAAALEMLAQNQKQLAANQPKPVEDSAAQLARRRANDPWYRLVRPVYQHGQPVQIKGCSDATVENLNNLVPGEYINKRVKVTVKGEAPNEQVHINYPIETAGERMKNAGLFSSFSDLLQKIADEQKTAK